jgi:hypothetical protein
MHNFHGGAIQKNPEKSGIDAIIVMLGSPTAKLKVLSENSKFGFIFELTIDEDESEYTRNDGVAITSFILKLVIISPKKSTEVYINTITRVHMDKGTETKETFLTDVRVQHNVWFKSMESGHEICPDLIDALMLDNSLSQKLIETIQVDQKMEDDEDNDEHEDKQLYRMLEHLDDLFKHEITRSYGIGLMIMTKVLNSVTVRSYLEYSRNYTRNCTAYSNIIAQIVRLFIENGILHLDLHHDNILINTDTLYCELIDFGKTKQLEPNVYEGYRASYQQLQLSDNIQKSKFMEETFNYIITLEKRENEESYIEWLSKSCIANQNNMYLVAFQILVRLMPPDLPLSSEVAYQAEFVSHQDPPQSRSSGKAIRKQTRLTLHNVGKIMVPSTKTAKYNATLKQRLDIKIAKEKELKDQRTNFLAREKERKKILAEQQIENASECNDYGWTSGCNMMGGKIKSIKRKTTKKKRIQRKNKTYKKHMGKQKQKHK